MMQYDISFKNFDFEINLPLLYFRSTTYFNISQQNLFYKICSYVNLPETTKEVFGLQKYFLLKGFILDWSGNSNTDFSFKVIH